MGVSGLVYVSTWHALTPPSSSRSLPLEGGGPIWNANDAKNIRLKRSTLRVVFFRELKRLRKRSLKRSRKRLLKRSHKRLLKRPRKRLLKRSHKRLLKRSCKRLRTRSRKRLTWTWTIHFACKKRALNRFSQNAHAQGRNGSSKSKSNVYENVYVNVYKNV